MATKKELLFNAGRWIDVFRRERRPQDRLGCVMIFYDTEDMESSAVAVGSHDGHFDKQSIIKACRIIDTKANRIIIDPYGRL